jgi:Domain of unknown function (DUF4190)
MSNNNYPPQPPPPNYAPPPMYALPQNSTLAIISMIAGILGFVGFIGIGPIIAVITGHMAKSEIKKSGGHVIGGGMATAGLILGYLNLVLTLVALCLFIVLPLLGFGGLALCPFFTNNFQ